MDIRLELDPTLSEVVRSPAMMAEAEALLARLETLETLLGFRKEGGGPPDARGYLALAAAVKPVLRLMEGSSDIPVLTGLLYPYVLLPFFCLVTGWSVGGRRGPALLYQVVCSLLTVPHVFLLYKESAQF